MDNKFGSRSNWKRLGINNRDELKSRIMAIFEKNDHQEQVLIGLYRIAFHDWDQILKIRGYPEVGNEMWLYVCRLFQKFDHDHHPHCMPGGAWMNTGFSVNHKLEDWEISFENCQVEYNKPIQSKGRYAL